MKKFSKILCAVLCLALICTGLAFIVSANDTPDTVTQTVSSGDLKAADLATDIEGNMLVDAGFTYYQYNQRTDPNGDGKYNDGAEIKDKSQLDAFVVTPAGATDSYVVLSAGQYMDGTSQWNIQHSATVANDKLVPLTNDSYYVVDLDMATSSELIEGLSLSLCNRNASGGEFPFGNVKFSDFVDLTEEWVHFTAVGSIKTNTVYVFVNGEYVGTAGNAANPSVLGSKTAEEYGLHAQGIKIEVPYNENNPSDYNIFANQSAAIDNLARRNYTDAESIAALDAIIESETKDLTQWEGYPENVRTGSLPAYVEIDGVEYTDLGDAAEVLADNVPKTVNVLNSFPGGLHVACDATINMNGCTGNIWAVEGAVVTEANGVVTVDAPFRPSMSSTQTSVSNDFINATKPSYTGETYKAGIVSKNIEGHRTLGYVVNNNIDGNTYFSYLAEHVDPSDTTNHNEYIDLQWNVTLAWDPEVDHYLVLDLDMAALSELEPFNVSSVCRAGNPSNTGGWGSGLQLSSAMTTWDIGEFHHVTVVYDFTNNDTYLFADNQLVSSNTTNGIMNAGGHSAWMAAKGNTVRQEAMRLGQNSPMDVAMDNVAMRYFTNDDSLAAAITAGNLSGWTSGVYGTYTAPEAVAPIAYANGEAVYTDDQLQSKLSTRAELQVEIVADTALEFVVAAKAVVNTNGLKFNGTVAEGGTQSTEGNVATFVGPFVASGTHALVDSATAVKGYFTPLQAAGSLPLTTDWSPSKASHVNMYHSTDNNTGNVYMTFQPKEGTTAFQDIQIGESLTKPITISMDDYYVVDVDIATENEIPEIFYITSQIYPASGSNGKDYPFLISFHPAGFIPEDGFWHHVTIVGDLAENRAWLFVDGVLIDDERTEDFYAFNATAEQLEEWGGLQLYSIKMSNDTNANAKWDSNQSVAIDSLSLRYFTDGTAIEEAISAGTTAGWAENQTGVGGALPEVAVIDGVKYHNVKTAAAALEAQTETAHEVELSKDIFANIVTNSSANVTTHGFTDFAANAQPEKIGDMLFASNFYVEGDSYVRLNESNYAGKAVGATWYSSDWSQSEMIYYPIGTKISYVGEMFELKSNYIEDGKLYNDFWADYNSTKIEEFPVAETNGYYMFLLASETTDTDLTVKGGLKYNMSLYANFDVNLYVPVSTGVVGETTKTIDGVEYVLLTQSVPVTTADGNAVYYVEFVKDGVTYTEKVVVNIIEYSVAVLDSATVSHQMKRVIMSALAYVNEAQALLNGGKVPAITNILGNAAYAEYVVEHNTEYGEANTDELAAVISGAQLKLGSEVAFVLNVADGFEGEIKIAYNDYKDQANTLTYNVKSGEQIVLNLKVYNLDSTLNITAGEVSGSYNLGGYIKGLAEAGTEAEFAKALFTYAKVAQAYKHAVNEAVKAAG